MTLIVQKFGGTSVGGIDRIEGVADRIAASREAGDDVVVVLSAMAGETDRLLGLARAISTHGRPNPRELDVLLSTGEQVTIALLCMALEKRGVTARSFNGLQAGIRTDNGHTKARILEIDASALREQLGHGRVPVIAGFQGVDEHGNVTTLGRGGSDTTAVAVAAALEADECRIFTDVDGVYTTDPRVVPEARRLDRISFAEMLEMAGQGSKVLQIRSVEFAHKYNVPLRVLSTFDEGGGTLIVERLDPVESARIAGIACSSQESEIRISGVPAATDAAWQLLAPLADSRIDIDMIVQNMATDGRMNFAFTVNRQDYEQAREILALQFAGTNVQIDGDSRVAKVGLIGAGVRSQADVAARMFAALARAGVAVRQIATSELRISVVVDEIQMENAVRALHHEFRLGEPEKAVKAG
ncbi:MAG TPA: aspartate kinase [Gammaproteobacteria bacterium]